MPGNGVTGEVTAPFLTLKLKLSLITLFVSGSRTISRVFGNTHILQASALLFEIDPEDLD